MNRQERPVMDMCSDEVVQFYAVEFVDRHGEPHVRVLDQPDERDALAKSHEGADRGPVLVYTVIAPVGTDRVDAEEFARENMRSTV